MELRVLRYFRAVADEGSITDAAKALHVTQPTLSRQLAQLENELGTPLFARGRGGIELTDRGVVLYRYARNIIDLAETQRTIADEATNEPATFSLCGDLANGGELSLNLMHALHYDDDRDMRFLEGLLSAHKGWVVADDDAIMAMGPQHTPHPTVTLHVPADELDSVRDVVASVRAEVGRDAVRGIEDMVATSSYKDVTDLVFDCVPEGSALEENVNRLEASLVRRRIPYRRDSFDASGLMREERTDMADRESSVCEDIRCPRCGDAIETCGTLSLRPDGNVMRTTICAHCGTHVVIDYVLAGIMPMTRTEG